MEEPTLVRAVLDLETPQARVRVHVEGERAAGDAPSVIVRAVKPASHVQNEALRGLLRALVPGHTLAEMVTRVRSTGARVTLRGPFPRAYVSPVWRLFDEHGRMQLAVGDLEARGLHAGLRTLIKREVPRAMAAWIAPSLTAEGFVVRVFDAEPARDGVVVFAARSESVLTQAFEAERAYRTQGTARDQACVWLGAQLGYPSCCVRSFLTSRAHDDITLFFLNLGPDVAQGSPASLWLHGPLRVVSHTACSLVCANTVTLGRALLDRARAHDAHDAHDEAAAWGGLAMFDRLARGVHLLDPSGGYWVAQGEGALSPESTWSVTALWKADFERLRMEDHTRARLSLHRVGPRVEVRDAQGEALTRAWVVADHRGS